MMTVLPGQVVIATNLILSTIDGLVYALVTAGVFAWWWPR